MPINVERFERTDERRLDREAPLSRASPFVFERHPDGAYTAAELAAILVGRSRATGGVPWSRTARTRESGWTSQEIDAVLHRLETQDLVRRKGPYWTIGDDVQEVLESEENV